MDLTNNINDPAGVKALLEQLRVSQAWQDLENKPQHHNPPAAPAQSNSKLPEVSPDIAPSTEDTASRVAELLAQLKSPSPLPPFKQPQQPPPRHAFSTLSAPRAQVQQAPASALLPDPNLRSCSYPVALTHLSRLGEDPAFTSAIKQILDEQNTRERQLWADREAILTKYMDKVTLALTKANLTGGGISKHEAMMLQDGYQRELRKFDQERVVPAWEGLVSRQQARLESLKVPNMFVTSDPKEREKQSQIIQVLTGLVQA
ncbi:hypothetical protein FA15DRAFT_664191 [Coprinopsis marcescibilis]|uniref:Uncharacterized protein n=1 Tax=Coprinopsis marcescibilis TaxID=230819 RepID=A0A5C3L926_COPMA|nr:hypothetical protein FA15DRAFT_664191 [Coprinopsis marcescibilis]